MRVIHGLERRMRETQSGLERRMWVIRGLERRMRVIRVAHAGRACGFSLAIYHTDLQRVLVVK